MGDNFYSSFNLSSYDNITALKGSIWCISTIFTFISLIIFIVSLVLFFLNLKKPKLQIFYILILVFIPVYTISALITVYFPPFFVWAESLRKW